MIKLICSCGNVMKFEEVEEVIECELGDGDEVYSKSDYNSFDLYANSEMLIIVCQECKKKIWTHTWGDNNEFIQN